MPALGGAGGPATPTARGATGGPPGVAGSPALLVDRIPVSPASTRGAATAASVADCRPSTAAPVLPRLAGRSPGSGGGGRAAPGRTEGAGHDAIVPMPRPSPRPGAPPALAASRWPLPAIGSCPPPDCHPAGPTDSAGWQARRSPAPVDAGLRQRLFRRRPTLPGGNPPSTIGAGRLNFRVREGNGCDSAAMATGNPAHYNGARPFGRSPCETSIASTGKVVPSPRPISTGRLNTLLCVHLRPINVVVYHGPYQVNPVGNLILERASHLDAFSAYPFRRSPTSSALGRTTGTRELRPSRSSRTRDSLPQISYGCTG